MPYDGFLGFLLRVGRVGPSMVVFFLGLMVGLFSARQVRVRSGDFVVEIGLRWFGDLMGWRSRGEASKLLVAHFMVLGRERERERLDKL